MYIYQLFGDGEIYSSRAKAHKRLCNIAKKNDDEFLPYKEQGHVKCIGWLEILYPNGYSIVRRPLL